MHSLLSPYSPTAARVPPAVISTGTRAPVLAPRGPASIYGRPGPPPPLTCVPKNFRLARRPTSAAKRTPSFAMAKAVAAALVLLVIVAMAFEAQAQGCPGVTSYQSCTSAVTKINQVPSNACCGAIATVLGQSNGAACLCAAMTSSIAKQFGVIPSEALKLPSKCRLNYQKGYRCAGEYSSCIMSRLITIFDGVLIREIDYVNPLLLCFGISGLHRPAFAFGCLKLPC